MCGLPHPADGMAHASGHHHAYGGHYQQHEGGERAEANPVGPHSRVKSRRRVGDAHRTVHDAIGDDGDRDEDETRAGGLRLTQTVRSAAAERRLDLGSVGEVLRRPPDCFGVGDAHPGRVDDHDPSSVGAVVGEQGVELREDAVLEAVLGAGGHDLCVAFDVEQKVVLLPPGEHDAEGDDHNRQGECRDRQIGEEEASGHGSARRVEPIANSP